MSKISGPQIPPLVSSTTPPPEGANSSRTVGNAAAAVPSDQAKGEVAKAAQGLLSYSSSRLVSGALQIFGDSVVLPSNLTDPNNPKNDVKYLHLLSAVLGLEELERYFFTLGEKDQEAYWEHKEKQREARWARLEREQDEESGGRDDDEDSSEEESSHESSSKEKSR